MISGSWLHNGGLKAGLSLGVCMALGQASLRADGVSRSVEPVDGGCRITIAWELTGRVESDLIIEERLASGWTVDGSTVPFGSLDASYLSGSLARFAVKSSILAEPGTISFVVMAGAGADSGTVVGDWKMYLNGVRRAGLVTGDAGLVAGVATTGGSGSSGGGSGGALETAVTINSFKIVGGGACELKYSGVAQAGTLVVEGCAGLGGTWTELKRMAVVPGDGELTLSLVEAGGCSFFRMKLLTEE